MFFFECWFWKITLWITEIWVWISTLILPKWDHLLTLFLALAKHQRKRALYPDFEDLIEWEKKKINAINVEPDKIWRIKK